LIIKYNSSTVKLVKTPVILQLSVTNLFSNRELAYYINRKFIISSTDAAAVVIVAVVTEAAVIL